MNARDKDKLITNRAYLVEHVNMDGLLTYLMAKKTINVRTKSTIEKAGSEFQQIEALLDVLARAGPKSFTDFCDALKDNNQDYIVTHLETETSQLKVRSVRKDVDEYVEVLAFQDNNNHIIKVPFEDVPHLSNKKCYSMPALSPTKENNRDTRYMLKHFVSVPERSSHQNLDYVPSKLTKRDSNDAFQNPSEMPNSKRQRLVDDADMQNQYNDKDLTNEIEVRKTTRTFYFQHYRKAYEMNHIPRGQAVIININKIDGMKSRKGSDIDASNLCTLLQQLHFIVTIYEGENLTAKNISHKVFEFSQMDAHETADATVVCLLSHGDDGHIFGSDGERVALDKLFAYFDEVNCPNLHNKPKIFIIQACRGDRVDNRTTTSTMGDLTPPIDEIDGPNTLTRSSSLACAPSRSDMIICYPTQQGYRAWRNQEQGSWFVQAIVKVFMTYSYCEDICAMMNRVNNMVSQKVSNSLNENIHGTMQMSEFHSSLRKPHLYFFPGIGSY